MRQTPLHSPRAPRLRLLAAAAAGMDAVGVTWGAGKPSDLRALDAAAVVDTVEELRAVLLPGSPRA